MINQKENLSTQSQSFSKQNIKDASTHNVEGYNKILDTIVNEIKKDPAVMQHINNLSDIEIKNHVNYRVSHIINNFNIDNNNHPLYQKINTLIKE